MLKFTELTLDDINTIKPFFIHTKDMICDNTVGGSFMWRDYFKTEFARCNGTVFFKAQVKYHYNKTAFTPPFGGDFKSGINSIIEYCNKNDLPVVFFNVAGYYLEMLHEVLGEFKSCYYSDWSDYIYVASDLINLSGKKYHGQKNHLNFFKKTNTNYTFSEINKENIPEVIEFFKKQNSGFNKTSDILSEEYVKTLEVFDNYDLYNMLGGLVRVNNNIVAFSLGEILNNVLFIHIEKADANYRGAYQAINNEFLRYFCTDNIKIVNRAEDNGDLGLRTAKQAYHPCGMLNKHIVEI